MYTTYYINYKPPKEQWTWGDYIQEDAAVIIAVPVGDETAIEAVLKAYLGAAEDMSGVCETTTTTTSTSTTTTTSTTTLIP